MIHSRTVANNRASGDSLPVWLSFDGSRFTGTPPADFNGILDIDVTASDGALVATNRFRLEIAAVNDAPSLVALLPDANSLEDGAIDVVIPQGTFADVDGNALNLTARLASGDPLPSWLLFDGARFTGTPPLNFNGALEIEVQASDGQYAVGDIFRLTIDPVNDAPIFAKTPPIYEATEDTTFALDVSGLFSDVDSADLVYSASNLPAWLQFDAATRTFSGVPGNEHVGDVTITLAASDGEYSTSGSINIRVANVNDAPTIGADVILPAIAEDSAAIVITAAQLLANSSDLDNGDTLVVTGLSASSGSVIDNNNGSWTFTPAANDDGEVTFTYGVSDGAVTVAARAYLDLIPVNDAPVVALALADQQGPEDQAIEFVIPASTFTDVDGDALTLSARLEGGAALPGWLSFADGRLTGQPPLDFNGILDIVVTASDGDLATTSIFRLTISPVNDRPKLEALLPDISVNEDSSVDITIPLIAFADIDGDSLTLSARLAGGAGLPTWLAFDGTRLTGQPPLDFHGHVDIEIVASDGALAVTDVFRLMIDPLNDAPVILVPLADMVYAEDRFVDISVPSAMFGDVDGDALSVNVTLGNGAPLPAWLLYNAATGRLTGQPPANYHGIIELAATASDGGLNVTDAFRLEILSVNDAPALVYPLTDVIRAEDSVIDIALAAGSFADIDGDNLILSARLANGNALPNWLSFDGSRFTGTPPVNFNGFVDIEVFANDGQLAVSDVFRLTISPANDGPIVALALADRSVAEDSAIDFTLPSGSFADFEGDALTYSVTLSNGSPLPAWLSFNAATQRFTGLPPSDFNGFLDVQVTASDGSLSVSDEFRLTVAPVNDAPVVAAALADQAVPVGSAINISVPAGTFTDVDSTNLNLSASLAGGGALPGWLTFANGVFSGTAPANAGNYDIRITASDGSLSVSDEFQLAVTGALNTAPVANNDGIFVTVRPNSLVILASDLLLNDSDLDGNPLTITAVGNGSRGTVALDASGNVVYTPDGAFEGSDSFTYTISDGGLTATASVSVRVDSPFIGWSQGTGSSDKLFGNNAGTNRLFGGAGDDHVKGGNQADWLAGGTGNDKLQGLNGDDHLWGMEGNDELLGNGGMDTAYFFGLRSSYLIVTQNGVVSVVDTQPTVDGDDGTDMISSIERLSFKNGETANVVSPIILDLDCNGVKTIAAAESLARYDLDGDGLTDDTSWIGNTEGFLFLDRDGNGTVTNAGEFSFIDDVVNAKSDLEGLRAFDSNKDGSLSSLDAKFAEFKVWQDRDGDGAAEANEILSLTQAGVRSINLAGTMVNGSTKLGEVAVINKGSYTRTNGSTMEFLDAALTYFSSATNLPEIAVQQMSYGKKASKYVISYSDGSMTLNPAKKKGEIDLRAGALTASSLLTFKNKTVGMLSPIILDLDGDGVEMRSIKKAKAAFDMNGDGAVDDTGWVGKDDGFLVIDRNNDGRINHASELSFAAEDPGAVSDLEALSALDNNGDGVLNKDDVRFGELKVWQDVNGNGVTDAGELKTLASLGITEIGLRGQNREGKAGVGDNILISTTSFKRENGSTGTVGNVALAYTPGRVVAGNTGNGGDRRFAPPNEFPLDDEIGPNGFAIRSGDGLEQEELRRAVALLRNNANSGSPSYPFTLPEFDSQSGNVFDYFEQLDDTSAKPALQSVEPVAPSQSNAEKLMVTGSIVSAIPLSSDSDHRLALMTQDMAAFGVRTGEQNPMRREGITKPVDYFA